MVVVEEEGEKRQRRIRNVDPRNGRDGRGERVDGGRAMRYLVGLFLSPMMKNNPRKRGGERKKGALL